MWIDWNDPAIESRTKLLLEENGGDYDASALEAYEFFEVNGYEDLDRLEELSIAPERELKIVQDQLLVPWQRSDLQPIASFYAPPHPEGPISSLKEEKDHQGYPLLIARLKKYES